jgi:hypothetical protein
MGKKGYPEPQANDWLYACPIGLPSAQIAAALGVPGQPITEMSGRGWDDYRQLMQEIDRAYNYGRFYIDHSSGQPNWNAINDLMLNKCVEGNWKDGWRFVGELVILRDISTPPSVNLLSFVETVAGHIRAIPRRRLWPITGRIVLGLEGWTQPALVGRTSWGRVAWVVNPLPPEP